MDWSIIGNAPVSQNPTLRPLRSWLSSKNIKAVFGISTWKKGSVPMWKWWKCPARILSHLDHLWKELLQQIRHAAPINRNEEDWLSRGPISGNYSVKEGYSTLSESNKYILIPLAAGNNKWISYSIPKNNFFNWILAHEKILTAENLSKCGIHGPSWCALCKSKPESSIKFFLNANLQCLFGA